MSILRLGDAEPKPSKGFQVLARSSWLIPATQEIESPKEEWQMRNAADLWLQSISDLTVRSISSFPYNCVGMIFANRRASIDIDHIGDILREDGYRPIEFGELWPGDIVLYKNGSLPTHVALVIDISRVTPTSRFPVVTVLSKWGTDPEFVHPIRNVPKLYGTPVAYYTDRISNDRAKRLF